MANEKDIYEGVNPIPTTKWCDGMVKYTSPLSFVLSEMKGMMFDETFYEGFNFNPYVIDIEGNKVYYQRDLCWTLEDKQNLIDSIYNEMNCGVLVLRFNDTQRAKDVHANYDVIDGKQRLSTIIEFFNNEFPDKNGHYWKDFSVVAQRQFKYLQPFTIYEFKENVSDAKIINAFLNVNNKGVPINGEHIDFVKSIKF